MSWTKIGAVTGAILGVAAVAGLVGFQYDKPAWKSDVEEIAEKTTKNTEWILEQRQRYLDDRRDRYNEEKKPTPKWLKDRQRSLNRLKDKVLTKPKK